MDTETYKKHRITFSTKLQTTQKKRSESHLKSAGAAPAAALEFIHTKKKDITKLLEEAITPKRRNSGDISESAKTKERGMKSTKKIIEKIQQSTQTTITEHA